MKGTGRALVAAIVLAALLAAGSALAKVNGTTHKVSGVGELLGVACPPKGDCIAVGETPPTSKNVTTGLFVPISKGKPGTAKKVSGSSVLSHVACPADNMCIAVGSSISFSNGKARYDTWYLKIDNGKAGHVHSLGMNAVASIGCGSASSCWVLGQDFPPNPTGPSSYHPKIVHLVKGKVDKVYSPSGSEEFTAGESGGPSPVCFSASFCVVGGTSGYQMGATGLLMTLNKGTVKVTHKIKAVTAVSGLHCTSKKDCTIVGDKTAGETSSGEVLKLSSGKLGKAKSTTADIFSLACSSASKCFTFGSLPTSKPPPKSVIVPINDGDPGSPQHIGPFIGDATCKGTACLGVGTEGQYPNVHGAVFSFKG